LNTVSAAATPSGTDIVLIAPDREQLVRKYGADGEGPPQHLLNSARSEADTVTMEAWPLADGLSDYSDGEYRITVPYWGYAAPLSAAGDTNWFTTNASLYLIFRATAEAFMVDWDEDRAALWMQRAAEQRLKAINLDKRMRVAEMDTWVPYRDAFDPHLDG
jgi:hypothetical protein